MNKSFSKWSSRDKKINIANLPSILPPGLKTPNLQAILLRARYEEIQYKLSKLSTEAQSVLEFDDRLVNESNYDQKDLKTDTNSMKARDSLYQERKALIESIDKIYPCFRVPGASRIAYTKCTKKFYIPGPNFIGQILGPRGETLKQLESQYGVKISIRGKGSTPDNKSSGEVYVPRSPDEPLHALIESYNEQSIEDVVKILEAIVIPKPDKENELKKAQLRQLAVYNGVIPATPPPPKPKPKEIENVPPPWFDKTLNLENVEVDSAIDTIIDRNPQLSNIDEITAPGKMKWKEKMKKFAIDLKLNDISSILPGRPPPGYE